MKYLFLTENFGYGPISSLCTVSKEMKKKYSQHELIFLGTKELCDVAKESKTFDKIVECNSYQEKDLKTHYNLIKSANKIIAVETTDVLIQLHNNLKLNNMYLIDNLFWLWDFLEDELKCLKKYFISNIISVKENVKRIGQGFNLKEVGPIRNFEKFYDCSKNNNLLISFGGGECAVANKELILKYYINVLQSVEQNLAGRFKTVYVCAGKNLCKSLSEEFKNKKFKFKNLPHDKYLGLLYKCSHIICSPGLGNFNEICSSNIKCMFLQAINYSQYYQYEYYKQLNLDFYFHDYKNKASIQKYLPEEQGVKEILNLLKNNINDSILSLNKKMFKFLNDFEYSPKRKLFYDNLDKNAILEIIDTIEKE